MATHLHGLSLQFYRGIGETPQQLGPFSDFNFFVGENNSGKSIVLNFISDFLPIGKKLNWANLEHSSPLRFRGDKVGTVKVRIGVPEEEIVQRLVKKLTEPATKK